MSDKGLTLYHTILTFNDLKEDGFGKHCGERRKCWQPAFSPFFHSVFPLLKRGWSFYQYLSSANALNLVTPKFCRLVQD